MERVQHQVSIKSTPVSVAVMADSSDLEYTMIENPSVQTQTYWKELGVPAATFLLGLGTWLFKKSGGAQEEDADAVLQEKTIKPRPTLREEIVAEIRSINRSIARIEANIDVELAAVRSEVSEISKRVATLEGKLRGMYSESNHSSLN